MREYSYNQVLHLLLLGIQEQNCGKHRGPDLAGVIGVVLDALQKRILASHVGHRNPAADVRKLELCLRPRHRIPLGFRPSPRRTSQINSLSGPEVGRPNALVP